MANPWELYAPLGDAVTAPVTDQPWNLYASTQAATGPMQDLPRLPWKGGVLPVSSDSEGNISFDSSAGLLAPFTLPKRTYTGEVDLNTPQGFAEAVSAAPAFLSVPPPVNAMVRPSLPSDVPVPTSAELATASNAGYSAARSSGVDYNPNAIASVADTTQRNLEADGYLKRVAPTTHGILDDLQAVPNQPSVVPIAALEAARQGLSKLAGTEGPDGAAASRAMRGITDFMANPPPAAVVSGPATEAGATIAAARGNWAAKERSDQLANIAGSAENRAGATHSGTNLDNVIRQEAAKVIDPKFPDRARGYTDEEIDALRKVAQGGPIRNVSRLIGNMLGGGGGIGSIASGAVGSVAAGTPGAVIFPTAGLLLRKANANMTMNALDRVGEMTRMRSPLFGERLAAAPSVPVSSPGVTAGIANAGLLGLNPPDDPRGLLARIWQNPRGILSGL